MPARSLGLASGRQIGGDAPTFVIAELGQNHNGRRDWAEQLVDAAAWAGADAVKTVKRDLACELTTAADVVSAEAAAIRLGRDPLLVLCDFWLRDGQRGIDFLRRLPALTTAPVCGILVSGDTGPEPLRAARESGIPLLQKPVSPAKLRAVITHFALELRGATKVEDRDEDPSGR